MHTHLKNTFFLKTFAFQSRDSVLQSFGRGSLTKQNSLLIIKDSIQSSSIWFSNICGSYTRYDGFSIRCIFSRTYPSSHWVWGSQILNSRFWLSVPIAFTQRVTSWFFFSLILNTQTASNIFSYKIFETDGLIYLFFSNYLPYGGIIFWTRAKPGWQNLCFLLRFHCSASPPIFLL